MWIIVGFVVFVGILWVVQFRVELEKDAKKAEADALKQARREKIATSPHIATIAQAIISHWGLPDRIKIDYDGVSAFTPLEYRSMSYASLGIKSIGEGDCSTLATALCSHPLLKGKYERRIRVSSDSDEEYWLELIKPAASKTLQEW